MAGQWRPLSEREGRGPGTYAGPFEGVPEWMFGELWDWVINRFGGDRYVVAPDDVRRYRGLASALRISLEDETQPNPSHANGMRRRLHGRCIAKPELLLDIADFWLGTEASLARHGSAIDDLEALLLRGGSAYRVERHEPPFLARRVAPEAQRATEGLFGEGRAGEHLRLAWAAAYRRNPDPSSSYREAIKAVEAAAIPVISPNNRQATLGTVIGEIRANPARWRVNLHGPDPAAQVGAVQAMLELLWKGQSDRHGTPDPTVPLAVSLEQAEAAVHLATVLVEFFARGLVTQN